MIFIICTLFSKKMYNSSVLCINKLGHYCILNLEEAKNSHLVWLSAAIPHWTLPLRCISNVVEVVGFSLGVKRQGVLEERKEDSLISEEKQAVGKTEHVPLQLCYTTILEVAMHQHQEYLHFKNTVKNDIMVICSSVPFSGQHIKLISSGYTVDGESARV